jgi:hypothetical protein
MFVKRPKRVLITIWDWRFSRAVKTSMAIFRVLTKCISYHFHFHPSFNWRLCVPPKRR